jgi:D-glycerate 3-kinase
MLGFKPLSMEVVKAVDPQVRCVLSLYYSNWSYNRSYICLISQLETVNKNLEAYYDAWDKFIKAWIVIKIKDPSCVYQWRLQVGYNFDLLP